MRRIEVSNLQSHVPEMTQRIVAALEYVLAEEGVSAYRLSVALVDDDRIRELNRRFLGRDETTDVLSFPLPDETDAALAGEIVASAERAQAVATARGSDAVGELVLYAVHGCLHLLDYDDRASAEARRMHGRASEILTALGYTDVPPAGS